MGREDSASGQSQADKVKGAVTSSPGVADLVHPGCIYSRTRHDGPVSAGTHLHLHPAWRACFSQGTTTSAPGAADLIHPGCVYLCTRHGRADSSRARLHLHTARWTSCTRDASASAPGAVDLVHPGASTSAPGVTGLFRPGRIYFCTQRGGPVSSRARLHLHPARRT